MARVYGSVDFDDNDRNLPLYQVTAREDTADAPIECMVHAADDESAKQKVLAQGFQMWGIHITEVIAVKRIS